jgi:hypothetical protein
MHATPAILQKYAPGLPRSAQPSLLLRPIYILALEILQRHSQIRGQPENVGIRQIHEALPVAAARASGLAFKSQFTGAV